MSPDAQRIAIAEACGHSRQEPDSAWFDSPSDGQIYIEDLPDYLNDLNAMHEAELTLLKNDALFWHKYASYLDENYVNQPYTVGATAAQRAGALLRTIGKWEDGK